MKVGIIGLGYVGGAVAWAHQPQTIIMRDPKLKDSADLSEFVDCDVIYVCVPSPSTEDGHCDSSILESTLKELLFVLINKQIPIICKTTAPPSVYARLQQEYPNIVYAPEFLTAANHLMDYVNTKYVVLGGDYEWCVKARAAIKWGLNIDEGEIIIVDIKTASLYKYMVNCYLATKVTFMNDFANLAEQVGVDWADLKFLATYEDRIGASHMNVPGSDNQRGWGGMCFPKDVAAIQMEALDQGTELELLGRVEDINKKHRRL